MSLVFRVEISGMVFFMLKSKGSVVILFPKPYGRADRRVNAEYYGLAVSLVMERLVIYSLLFMYGTAPLQNGAVFLFST